MIPFLLLGAGLLWVLNERPNVSTITLPSGLTQREQELLRRIGETYPNLLTWIPVPVSSRGHSGTMYVARDYWGLGPDFSSFLRVPLSPRAAQWVADQLGAVLPTRKMVDIIERNARLIPFIAHTPRSGESRNSQRLWESINNAISTRMGEDVGLVAGHKKDVIVGNLLGRSPEKVIIYGGRYEDGRRVQATSNLHGDFYADYSHGIRLVKKEMDVDGQSVLVGDVLRSRELSGLLSDEGPVVAAGLRYRV